MASPPATETFPISVLYDTNGNPTATVAPFDVLVALGNYTTGTFQGTVVGPAPGAIVPAGVAVPTGQVIETPWPKPSTSPTVAVPSSSSAANMAGNTVTQTGPSNTAFTPTSTFVNVNGNGSVTTKDSTKTTSAVSQSSAPGLASGAVAGVAIGCLIIGALVAFAIAFFWFKRRRNNQYDGHSPVATTVVTDLKGYDTPLPPAPLAADNSSLDKFLLDSTSDKDIAAELHALGTLIQSHVENNYHSGTVLVNKNTLSAALIQLGVQMGGSLRPSELASLALAPVTRQAALQHVISQVVFTSIDAGARSQLSMLPSPVAAFLQSIPPHESGNHADVTSIALNKWRALSAFLLHPTRSQRTPLPASGSAIAAQAERLADALNRFLQYFVSGDEQARAQQTNHLRDVIVECSKLGYTVLSQPRLVKVTHRDGTPFSSPIEVVAPTIVRV